MKIRFNPEGVAGTISTLKTKVEALKKGQEAKTDADNDIVCLWTGSLSEYMADRLKSFDEPLDAVTQNIDGYRSHIEQCKKNYAQSEKRANKLLSDIQAQYQ